MKISRARTILFLTVTPCLTLAQNPASGTPSTPASSSPSTAQSGGTGGSEPKKSTDPKKPKKVWTNDELGSVNGTVSVVGEASANNGARMKVSSEPSSQAKQKLAESYRSQIGQLQTQMDAIDKRISQLKNFKGENTTPSGGINPNQGYNMVPVEDQVKQLEDRKKLLQSKIDDLENDAKKNGIEPGDLR